jgi:hypothetical protein
MESFVSASNHLVAPPSRPSGICIFKTFQGRKNIHVNQHLITLSARMSTKSSWLWNHFQSPRILTTCVLINRPRMAYEKCTRTWRTLKGRMSLPKYVRVGKWHPTIHRRSYWNEFWAHYVHPALEGFHRKEWAELAHCSYCYNTLAENLCWCHC